MSKKNKIPHEKHRKKAKYPTKSIFIYSNLNKGVPYDIWRNINDNLFPDPSTSRPNPQMQQMQNC